MPKHLREVVLGPGELFVVPRGVEHQPFAEEEMHLLLIEPSGTPNTGDAATAAPDDLAGESPRLTADLATIPL